MPYRVTYRGRGEYWVFGHRFAAGQQRIVESEQEVDYLRRQQAGGRPLFDVEPIPEPAPEAQADEASKVSTVIEAAVTVEAADKPEASGPMTADLDEGSTRRKRGR